MLMRFKQLTISLLLVGLSATAWSQPILVKSQQKIEEYKLENGFRVILAQNDKENYLSFSGALDVRNLNAFSISAFSTEATSSSKNSFIPRLYKLIKRSCNEK